MTVEKEQKPIVNWMLDVSYRDVVFRTIGVLLLQKVSDVYDSITITSGSEYLTPEELIIVKQRYLKEVVKDVRIKKDLQLELSNIAKRKIDIIAEILKQHQLDKSSESTYYHDTLSQIFDKQIWRMRNIVNQANYHELNI